MGNYCHLTITDRLEIEILLWKWYSITDIAKVLNRNKATISREIKRNAVKNEYVGEKACHKSYNRRHMCKVPMKKIRHNDELEQYIRYNIIDNKRSPEQVAWRWNKQHPEYTISYVRVYEYIDTIYWQDIKLKLQQRNKYRHRPKLREPKLQYRIWIQERHIWEWEFGHCEWDSMEWPRGDKWLLSTRIEKLSRFMFADKLEWKSALETEKVLYQWLQGTQVKTLTLDNWLEFANHYKLWIPTYFCDPYSSWQKWQIERWNREIRKFIPKKSKLSLVTKEQLANIIWKINNTPRKCLWWDTPLEVFKSYGGVALEI
jgi:IS30 family transposase